MSHQTTNPNGVHHEFNTAEEAQKFHEGVEKAENEKLENLRLKEEKEENDLKASEKALQEGIALPSFLDIIEILSKMETLGDKIRVHKKEVDGNKIIINNIRNNALTATSKDIDKLVKTISRTEVIEDYIINRLAYNRSLLKNKIEGFITKQFREDFEKIGKEVVLIDGLNKYMTDYNGDISSISLANVFGHHIPSVYAEALAECKAGEFKGIELNINQENYKDIKNHLMGYHGLSEARKSINEYKNGMVY